MKILVNNEELSVTLEDEKTVGEIYNGISKQFSELKKQIAGVRVNGNYINMENQKELSIADISEIHFDIVSTNQLFLDSMIGISNYLHRALGFLLKKEATNEICNIDSKEKDDLYEGLSWLMDSINIIGEKEPKIKEALIGQSAKGEKESNDLYIILENFKENFQANMENSKSIEDLIKIFTMLKENIDSILNTLKMAIPSEEEIIEKMAEFVKGLPNLKDSLSLITDLIHEGKDGQAFEKVTEVSFILQKYMLLIPAMDQSGMSSQILLQSDVAKNLQEANKLMLEQLTALADSMENNDSVSITDICEYELPELLELIPPAFSQIKSHYN